MNWFSKLRIKPPRVERHFIIKRTFDAADTGRLYADWSGDYGMTANELKLRLPTILKRTRERAKNDPYMKKYLAMCKANIVGPDGFSLALNIRDASGKPDTGAINELEEQFGLWAESADFVDAAGKKTLWDFDMSMVNSWARDGEVILRLLPGFRFPENPYAFSLKLYRPDVLDVAYNERLPSGNRIVCGVEMDTWGRPLAYHFIADFDIDLGHSATYSGRHIRIPAEQITHYFIEEDEDQPRGVPPAHAVLTSLKMSDGYDMAELTAARDSSCSIGTYYAKAGEDMSPAELSGDEIQQDRAPGQKQVLPQGWEYKEDNPVRPNAAYPEFKKAVLRRIASGLLVDYNTFANDLEGVNFSSLRDGKLTERDLWKIAQASFIAHIKRPVFAAWLRMYLSSGRSKLPLYKIDKFRRDKWTGRRWPWVDPLKDARAAEVHAAHGWKTDTQITAEIGGDYADNVLQAERDAQLRKGTVLDESGKGNANE